MFPKFLFLVVLILIFSLLTTYTYAQLSGGGGSRGGFTGVEGNYCETRIGGCCPGRFDECSVPLYGTLCYCDHFCNRTDNPDCCPDYYNYCLGIKLPPPEELRDSCFSEGKTYPFGSTHKINCKECKCDTAPNDKTKTEFLCETDKCIIEPSLIEVINDGNFLWTASNYSDFWGHKLSEGILYKLGTLEPERGVKNMEPIKHIYDETLLPKSFDARKAWPKQIHPVLDQGWCGADWAMTTSTITADRLAIQSKGVEVVQLSTQHLVSCDSRGQQGCTGGHLDRAWNFMRRFGIVDEECYPYKSGTSRNTGNCLVSRRLKTLLEINQCRTSNTLSGRTELYKTQPAYRISSNENDIKYEIYTFGPVQAVMEVSADFFMYHKGIYKRAGFRLGERIGHHSVRVIGWGEEFLLGGMVKYWLVSNTWGTGWGDNGYFKILRGENECEIETFVISAWARPGNKISSSRIESNTI